MNNSILIRHIEVVGKVVLLIKPVVTKQIELRIYHNTLLTIIELKGFWGFGVLGAHLGPLWEHFRGHLGGTSGATLGTL